MSTELAQIINHLADMNKENQDIFVLEEMAELQKELMKHRRGRYNRDNIVDESTDVLLTIFILLKAYGATEKEITCLLDYKLHRLRDFIS